MERTWVDMIVGGDEPAPATTAARGGLRGLVPLARRRRWPRPSPTWTPRPQRRRRSCGASSLDQPVPVPKGVPWFPDDVDAWSVRWVLLHLVEEIARHAGHADIIRESIDGATMFELMAAAEGWPATDWLHAVDAAGATAGRWPRSKPVLAGVGEERVHLAYRGRRPPPALEHGSAHHCQTRSSWVGGCNHSVVGQHSSAPATVAQAGETGTWSCPGRSPCPTDGRSAWPTSDRPQAALCCGAMAGLAVASNRLRWRPRPPPQGSA